MPKKKTESAYAYARRLLSEANSRVGEGHHHVVRELLGEAGKQATRLSGAKASAIYQRIEHVEAKLNEALTPEWWKPFAVGDRVVFNELPGIVSRVPTGNYGPTDSVTFLADGRKRGRRVEARLLRLDTNDARPPSAADSETDKALIEAFSAAIAAAIDADAA